jgi:putative hydrolase of the HAD superfamily
MSRRSGVVFDLDETLIDRRASIAAYAETFHLTFENLISENTETFISTFIRLDGNGYIAREKLFQTLASHIAHESLGRQTIESHFRAHAWKNPILVPGAISGLTRLRETGIPLGLVSNGKSQNQLNKIQQTGLDDLLDVCIISEAFGVKKPDPRIFEAAASELGIDSQTSWFVGDHPLLDIHGAAAVGFRTIWLERNTPWPAELPRLYDRGPCTLESAFQILAEVY